MHWLQHALTPNVADDDLRRYGFTVACVSLAMTLLVITVGGNTIRSAGLNFSNALTLGTAPLFIMCLILAIKGKIRLAAYIVTWFPYLVLLAVLMSSPGLTAVFFLAIPILLASVVLPSINILPITGLAVATTIFVMISATNTQNGSYFPPMIFLLMVCALAYLGARGVEQALQNVRDARMQLQDANNVLEQHVTERTSDLQQALTSLQQREGELQHTLHDLRVSHETISKLSTPILPVADGVLVVPLIGVLDTDRASQFMQNLLQAAEQVRARYLIIDVTGMSLIDTQVARVLLDSTRAINLLGSRVMLTGVRPEVAQTLVTLGISLEEINTRATLQSGIAAVLQ